MNDTNQDAAWYKEMHDKLFAEGEMIGRVSQLLEVAHAYYHGQPIVGKHNFLRKSVNGYEWPIDFQSFNRIKPIIDELVSRYSSRPKTPRVYADSPKGVARRLDVITKAEADFKLLPLYMQAEDATGQPMIPSNTPSSIEELEKLKDSYREIGERVYGALLNSFRRKYSMNDLEQECARDVFIGSRCFVESGLDHNMNYYVRRLDADKVIVDARSKKQHGEDSRFVAYGEYLPLSRAAEMYGLTQDQVDYIEKNGADQNIGIGSALAAFDGMEGSGIVPWARTMSGQSEPYVLTTRMEFKDYTSMVGLEYRGRTGTPHYRIFPKNIREEDKKKGIDSNAQRKKAKSHKEFSYETIHEVVVVGGTVVKYGEVKNMPRRSDDDWWKTSFSIEQLIAGKDGFNTTSVAELLMSLQDIIDRCMFMINKKMMQDRGKSTVVDTSQISKSYTLEDLAYLGESVGLTPVNGRGFGANSGYNQFTTLNQSIDASVSVYIQIASFAVNNIYEITGVNPSTGQSINPDTPVGTANIKMQGSFLKTEYLFAPITRFMERIYSRMIGLTKIAISENPDKFDMMLDEKSMAFIKSDSDFDLDDYGLSIETRSITADTSILQKTTEGAVLNGQIDFLSGVRILLEEDPTQALKQLEAAFEVRKREEKAMQQQQMIQQQQQMAQQGEIAMEKANAPVRSAEIAADAKLNTKRMDLSASAAQTRNTGNQF